MTSFTRSCFGTAKMSDRGGACRSEPDTSRSGSSDRNRSDPGPSDPAPFELSRFDRDRTDPDPSARCGPDPSDPDPRTDRTASAGRPEAASETSAVAESILAGFQARLPALPELSSLAAADEAEIRRQLRMLVRDAGRELKRLRNLPRSQTAPLARFREACRTALVALRGLSRASERLARARRRLEQLGSGSRARPRP